MTLEEAIDRIVQRPAQSPDRLLDLADYLREQLARHGLPGAIGGTGGELRGQGLAREKDWDVAYEFAGKFRLLISLKSMWRNAAGTIPNRLDDHMGEIANVQQIRPEIVIGYVVLFDTVADSRRKDGLQWSEYFERAIGRIAGAQSRACRSRGRPVRERSYLGASPARAGHPVRHTTFRR